MLAAAVVLVYRRPALLWLYSEFGADYKCPDSTRLNRTADEQKPAIRLKTVAITTGQTFTHLDLRYTSVRRESGSAPPRKRIAELSRFSAGLQ